MRGIRSIATVLLAAAYFSVAYVSSLHLWMPSMGSGVPVVQRAAGHQNDAPRPNWTPRRHLPLVKVFAFDQISVPPHGLTFKSFPGRLIPGEAAFTPEEPLGGPMCNRGPPVF
jgi:hypothetical protein